MPALRRSQRSDGSLIWYRRNPAERSRWRCRCFAARNCSRRVVTAATPSEDGDVMLSCHRSTTGRCVRRPLPRSRRPGAHARGDAWAASGLLLLVRPSPAVGRPGPSVHVCRRLEPSPVRMVHWLVPKERVRVTATATAGSGSGELRAPTLAEVRAGLPASFLDRLKGALEVTETQLASVVGIPRQTLVGAEARECSAGTRGPGGDGGPGVRPGAVVLRRRPAARPRMAEASQSRPGWRHAPGARGHRHRRRGRHRPDRPPGARHPVVKVWRIARSTHAASVEGMLSGEGAARYGGRWNPRGMPAVYCSENPSLAALEVLVNLPGRPRSPATASWTSKSRMERFFMPPEPVGDTRQAGAELLRTHLALAAPSAVNPLERNVVLSPAHPDFIRVRPRRDPAFRVRPQAGRVNGRRHACGEAGGTRSIVAVASGGLSCSSCGARQRANESCPGSGGVWTISYLMPSGSLKNSA